VSSLALQHTPEIKFKQLYTVLVGLATALGDAPCCKAVGIVLAWGIWLTSVAGQSVVCIPA
jgi:hypothetical protein